MPLGLKFPLPGKNVIARSECDEAISSPLTGEEQGMSRVEALSIAKGQ